MTFTLSGSVPIDRTNRSSFLINYGDQTPEDSIDVNGLPVSHRFGEVRIFNVGLYSADPKARRFQPEPLAKARVSVTLWTLVPPAPRVELGETFTLSIDNPPNDSAIRYSFHFSKDQEIEEPDARTNATYSYHTPGTFRVYADVLIADRARMIRSTTDQRDIVVNQLPANRLRLKAEPLAAEVGKEVSFTATFDSPFDANDPNVGFKFFYGDGKWSDWQRGRTSSHPYDAANDNYQAVVWVGWRNAQTNEYAFSAGSEPLSIKVAALQLDIPPPPTNSSSRPQSGGERDGPNMPPFVVYILAGLVVIALALFFASYKTWNAHYAARPEYVAHADRGSSQADDGRVTLEFELRLNRNSERSHVQIAPSPAGLIRFERITHD